MDFVEKKTESVETPILMPEKFEVLGVEGNYIKYLDRETGEEDTDEVLFIHDEDRVFLSQFRYKFENDSAIVLLFNNSGSLFLHRRSEDKDWAPGKIDLASIAGQRRALFQRNRFVNEESEQNALREISEETGINREKLKQEKLEKVGEHVNPETNEHQTVFAYLIDTSLEELNQNSSDIGEVREWIEQNYKTTMKEYFGEKVEKYGGGKDLRPKNFISDPEIRENLDKFHSRIS